MAEPVSPDAVRVDHEALGDFVTAVLQSHGIPTEHARLTADALVAADLYGIDSHGVARLGFYVHKITHDLVNRRPEPQVVSDLGATCLVDGDNGLGPVAAQLATDWCIERARDTGLACATVRRSNHYGIAGFYALQAVHHGMVGMSMTNATSLVAPTFGARSMLGTNPIAFAAPAGEERPFLFDAATSAVSFGKIQLALAEEAPIPEGWSIDAGGRSTTDSVEALQGSLLPLGSDRTRGSHKGYGLAVMVDILCGLLSAAAYGPHCLSLTSEFDQVADVGHFYLALRVDAFRPLEEFTATMDTMIRDLRATPPVPGEDRVIVAGEPEFDEEERRRADGIPLTPEVYTMLEIMAAERELADEFARLAR
jgi:LDH2 family malate/lactate/ureidoglycolate dehydrogenase